MIKALSAVAPGGDFGHVKNGGSDKHKPKELGQGSARHDGPPRAQPKERRVASAQVAASKPQTPGYEDREPALRSSDVPAAASRLVTEPVGVKAAAAPVTTNRPASGAAGNLPNAHPGPHVAPMPQRLRDLIVQLSRDSASAPAPLTGVQPRTVGRPAAARPAARDLDAIERTAAQIIRKETAAMVAQANHSKESVLALLLTDWRGGKSEAVEKAAPWTTAPAAAAAAADLT